MFCYSNDGMTMRAVQRGYEAKAGEVVFDHTPSKTEIASSFPGFAASSMANDQDRVGFAIGRECSKRIGAALQGKDASLSREEGALMRMKASGVPMSAEQVADLVTIDAINAWESKMVDKREALIAAHDVAAAAMDASWPAPPAGLAEFLKGF